METIGGQIKAERNRARMTQEELAKKLGVNRATLSKYESGAIDPPASAIEKMAQILKCNPALFFSRCQQCTEEKTEKLLAEVAAEFQRLNTNGKAEAVKRIKELAQLPQYTD